MKPEKCPFCGSTSIAELKWDDLTFCLYCRECGRIVWLIKGISARIMSAKDLVENMICVLRKKCFGLSACENCPLMDCDSPDKQRRLQELSKYRVLLSKMEKLYNELYRH